VILDFSEMKTKWETVEGPEPKFAYFTRTGNNTFKERWKPKQKFYTEQNKISLIPSFYRDKKYNKPPVFFNFMVQIIGGFPFTTDIVLISGTDSRSSRVEERINSLTGFYPFCAV